MGPVTPEVEARLDEEFHLVGRHRLAGFLLLYREIVLLAQKIMEEKGLWPTPRLHWRRGPRVGIGAHRWRCWWAISSASSHVDPLRWGLTLDWNESGAGSLTPRKPPSLAAMLVLFATEIPLLKAPMVVKGQRSFISPVDPSGYLSWRGYLRSGRAKIS